MMMTLLAQSTPDLSGVEGDFIKSWLIVFGFVVMIGLQVWGRVSGDRAQKREVSGELVTRADVPVATRAELEKLETALNDFREEQRNQHHKAVEAGQQRVASLTEVLNHEVTRLGQEVSKTSGELWGAFDTKLKAITDKLDLAASLVAKHDALVSQIEKRVDDLTQRHQEAVPRLHQRIDDVITISKQTRPRASK